MASAIASVNNVVFIDGIGLTIGLDVCYSGEDVPGLVLTNPVQAVINPDDSPEAITAALSAAVAQVGEENGLTVAGSNMILPAFTKG